MLVSFVVVMALFAMMFKWLPDVSVGWRDVWLGAFLTALFFEIGKTAIGFYIGKQGLESTYGAAASIVVVLIWVYYTSQIILMGAEITHSYAEHNGSFRRDVHEWAASPMRSRQADRFQAAVEAFELTPLRSATVLSLVFAAFSSFRLVVRKRTISSWPSSSAHAISVP